MSNIPGPKFGLNEIIDAFTQQVIENRNNGSKYNPLRPSASGKCERELGYEYAEFKGYQKYEREQNPPDVHRLLNLGHHIERHVLDEMYQAFKQSPTPIEIKYKQQTLSFFKLHDGTWIEGNIDLVIQTENWKMVCDIKSKSDKYSQFYKSAWDEFCEKLVATGHAVKFGEDAIYITDTEKFLETNPDVFFNNNIYQLNFYACNPFLVDRGINLASIIQSNKNDSRLREIRFTPSQAVYEKTKHKFEKVALIVDQEKSAENLTKDYVLGSQKCGFCPFKKQCWPEDDALKAYFSTLPPKQWPKDLDRLPAGPRTELEGLFKQYHELAGAPAKLEQIERKIVKILDEIKVYKVRLEKDQIYRVKRLKEGLVLRRDKL